MHHRSKSRTSGCARGFTPRRIKHLATALDRRASLGLDGETLRAWLDHRARAGPDLGRADRAAELGLTVAELDGLLAGTLRAGPEDWRRIGRALRRCREELAA